MSFAEYLEFTVFFGLLTAFIFMSYQGAFHTKRILDSKWGSQMWRRASPRGVKWFSLIFLVVCLAFLFFSVVELSKGTFKWKGRSKTYSFSDFVR
jgi:hypothetical protein